MLGAGWVRTLRGLVVAFAETGVWVDPEEPVCALVDGTCT